VKALLEEVRHNPLLWLLVLVPAVFAVHAARPEAHTLLFLLAVLAIGASAYAESGLCS
jgi:Ca2+:H+ antiporter